MIALARPPIAGKLGRTVLVHCRDGKTNARQLPTSEAMALAAACRARPDLYARVVLAAVFQDETLPIPPADARAEGAGS